MASDISSIDPERVSDITGHEYYKKLQRELKERMQLHKKNEQHKHREVEELNDKKVNKIADAKAGAQSKMAIDMNDRVSVRSFSWEKDESGEFQIKNPESHRLQTTVDIENDGLAIMRFMGIKIDFTEKLPYLKQSYMQHVIQSRSHNYFLSKYAGFKMGMVAQLLSSLGVSVEELNGLKKQAIEATVDDLIEQVCENIYNMELVTLVYGKSKKAQRPMSKFQEIQVQLLTQMKHMERADYWTPARTYEEQITQVKRIIAEFEAELVSIRSQFNYHEHSEDLKTQAKDIRNAKASKANKKGRQVKNDPKRVDTRVKDLDEEELTIVDLRKKSGKLESYIRRAQDRISRHTMSLKVIVEKDKKERELAKAGFKSYEKKAEKRALVERSI